MYLVIMKNGEENTCVGYLQCEKITCISYLEIKST